MAMEQSFLGRPVSRRAVLGGIAGAAAATGLATFGGPAIEAHAATAGVAASAGATTPFVTIGAERGVLGGGARVRSITPGMPAGATTPFVTIGAEKGMLGGGARVRSITPGMPVGKVATLELEASGYALVELASTGDSVTITNDTRLTANTIVVRASIPDAPMGGGITATLNLYVDGVFRQAVTLSSAQTWTYQNSTTTVKDPNGGGRPYHFYNEFPFWIEGEPITPGSTIMLQKDADNAASVYHIDCIDLEDAPAPLDRPAGSLSVIDYGADPNFETDSTIAIQTAVNDARTQGKSVWIPSGKYLTNSLAPDLLDFTGVTVQGSGVWHTIIHRNPPLPSTSLWRTEILVGSGTKLSDIQIDSNATFRGDGRAGGADSGFEAMGAGGWLIERMWTRHCDANWLSGSNATVQNCRTADSFGDGFNVNNSNTPNPDKLGYNITVRNNFARGCGDDGFAVYSDAGKSGASTQVARVKIINNTSVATWWANGIRIAGGQDIEVLHNLVDSSSSNSAMDIGVFGDTGNPLESLLVSGNVLLGGGGWNGDRHGVRISSPTTTSLFAGAFSNVTMTNNVMRGALRSGLFIDRYYDKVELTNNTIDGPANQGIYVRSAVTGSGLFTNNTVQNLRTGQVPYQNDSSGTFATKLNNNSWQSR